MPQHHPPDVDQAEDEIHPDYDEVDEGLDRAKGGLFDDEDVMNDMADHVFAFNAGKTSTKLSYCSGTSWTRCNVA